VRQRRVSSRSTCIRDQKASIIALSSPPPIERRPTVVAVRESRLPWRSMRTVPAIRLASAR
jgi:hypothetical protein